jgi:hypothetical protein
MQTYSLRKLSGRAIVGVVLAATALFGAFYAINVARAGVGLGVAPNFPSSVTVGSNNVAGSLEITNNSSGGDGLQVSLSNITLIPSCGANSGTTCTSPDLGVFSIDAAATGAGSCAANTFTVAVIDAATGKVQFTPNATINLNVGQTCTINFTFDVLSAPDVDSSGIAGLQTIQLGEASATEVGQSGLTGGGFGTDTTTISKASPSISTTPSAGGPIGTVLNDTATLTGGINPTGSVTFNLYPPSDPTCVGTAVYTQVDGSAPYATSPGYTSIAAGVYHWTANYAGDANNNAASSGCAAEPVTISKLSSTTTTTIHNTAHGTVALNSTIANGSTVHDSATVTGSGPTPTGDVDFTFFSGTGSNVCDAQSVASGTDIALVAGIADPSTAQGPLGAGSYSFRASYSGDANYNSSISACEPFNVGLASPSISTTPNPSSGSIGTMLNDTATLSGGSSPTGNVTFKLFPPSDATCSGAAVFTEVDGTAPYQTTTGFAAAVAGTYRWTADYAGDANNNAVSSGCQDEQVVIGKSSPTLSTTPNPASGEVGAVLNDSATLSGASSPTGSITFNLYAPGDATCSGAAVYTQVVALTGNSAATSPGYTSIAAGIYRWTASYPGDTNNNAASSGCEAEQVTITQPTSQGCSPGYWKQPQHFGNYPDGVFPNTLFVDVFGENAFPNMTLLQVLSQGGGGLNALGRIIVAAYLNASSVDNFAFTSAEVIADFQNAFPGSSSDYSTLKAKYEALQDPCPLGSNPGPAGAPTVQTSGVVTGDVSSGNDSGPNVNANSNASKDKPKKNAE